MNDEIKEIIEHIKNYPEKLYCLNENEKHLLLDYITNLQQEIKHYEETTTFGDYIKEVNLLVDYKSRIEKAVEYIEKHSNSFSVLDTISNGTLLNILNGKE